MSDFSQIRSSVPLPLHGRDQVRYASAYIHPSVRRVWIEDGGWWVETTEPLDQSVVDEGIDLLCRRFGSVELPELKASFKLPAPDGLKPQANFFEDGLAREILPGLVVLKPPFSDLMRFLDWIMLRRFARPFNAYEEIYPNVIPSSELALTNHFRAFPEHLHFVTHLQEDLGVLDQFAKRAQDVTALPQPGRDELASPLLVHNPSTCYHCYASRSGARLKDNEAVTAVTRCHRYEAANHADPGRLMEFTLRETIFIGEPDYVRSTREDCLSRIEQWASDWSLYGELLPANDPFFTDDYEAKAVQQHRLAMKYEYRAVLPSTGGTIAVLSSNLHSATFGKSFDMRIGTMRANSGCIGFGLERLGLALVEQHGLDPGAWPEGLRADYQDWRQSDALLCR